MKTYYYFDMELNLIETAEFETAEFETAEFETAEFETEAEAFDHCFSDPRICAWNDKPYIEI